MILRVAGAGKLFPVRFAAHTTGNVTQAGYRTKTALTFGWGSSASVPISLPTSSGHVIRFLEGEFVFFVQLLEIGQNSAHLRGAFNVGVDLF